MKNLRLILSAIAVLFAGNSLFAINTPKNNPAPLAVTVTENPGLLCTIDGVCTNDGPQICELYIQSTGQHIVYYERTGLCTTVAKGNFFLP